VRSEEKRLSWYHVHKCGAKFFCDFSIFVCPRCGRESRSEVQADPPWIGHSMREEDMSKVPKPDCDHEMYEDAKKLLEKHGAKVIRARAIVSEWETVLARNKGTIGNQRLMSYRHENGEILLSFETKVAAPQETNGQQEKPQASKETTSAVVAATR
jgi:hypothetical protein